MKVVKLSSDEIKALIEILSERFPRRDIPYGLQFKLPDGVVNIYTSGKVVVSPEAWSQVKEAIGHVMNGLERTSIGCDEAGKGELLGPVVTACVRVSPDVYRQLRFTGVTDSKEVSDVKKVWDEVLQILQVNDYASFTLSPVAYRRLHAHWGSINRVLEYMFLHTASLLPPAERVVIDAFSKTTVLSAFWPSLVFVPRGERFVEVALASVLAKVEYIRWIEDNVPQEVAQVARRSDISVEKRLALLSKRGYDVRGLKQWLKPWKNLV